MTEFEKRLESVRYRPYCGSCGAEVEYLYECEDCGGLVCANCISEALNECLYEKCTLTMRVHGVELTKAEESACKKLEHTYACMMCSDCLGW